MIAAELLQQHATKMLLKAATDLNEDKAGSYFKE